MAAKASYSETLERGSEYIILSCEEILEKINLMRKEFEQALIPGFSWRNYHEEVLVVFETISSLERETLYLVENTDVIRRKNDELLGS